MTARSAAAGVVNRTKWMRLSVRDLGDVIRWAGAQNAREISEFRYRVVNGREMVSFRLVPRYAIDIGAREIIDRKSTRLNSSHLGISYAVFCLKKKKKKQKII